MLEYHIKHHPEAAMNVTREEVGEAIKELLQEKRISRDVVAYKIRR